MQIILVNNHGNKLVDEYKTDDHARYGNHHVIGQGFYHVKIPEFQVLGVLLTSPAIVPTLSLTSVNMVSKLVRTHPCNSSFMNSVILSMIPPMNYENRVVSCGITVCATMMMPPPLISCLMPCDFAPGLSFPYPSRRLITPHTPTPAPIAVTTCFKSCY